MNNLLNEFLFGIYPYIVLGVFVVGCIARYDSNPYSWKAGSSQLLSNKGMKLGSNLFHVGVICLFMGHFVGLLTPEPVYHLVMSAGTKQVLAMVAGGIFGIVCLVGISILLHRRLTDPRIKATTTKNDLAILIILAVQLVLGLLTIPYSAQHLDGSSMIALANWAQHVVTFRGGAASFVLHEAWVFKVHLFLGMSLFLLTPFTRLVHVISAPVWYVFRTGYQIVRGR